MSQRDVAVTMEELAKESPELVAVIAVGFKANGDLVVRGTGLTVSQASCAALLLQQRALMVLAGNSRDQGAGLVLPGLPKPRGN